MPLILLNPKDMGKSDINITQTQQIVMGFISPIIDEIVDRVSERVLAASKKNLSSTLEKKPLKSFMSPYQHWRE